MPRPSEQGNRSCWCELPIAVLGATQTGGRCLEYHVGRADLLAGSRVASHGGSMLYNPGGTVIHALCSCVPSLFLLPVLGMLPAGGERVVVIIELCVVVYQWLTQ